MAGQLLDQDMMEELARLAQPLIEAAWARSEDVTLIEEGAAEDAIFAARLVASYQLVMQACLNAMPLNDIGRMVALASVSGAALGQIEVGRSQAYDIFKRQMAASMGEVARALTPSSEARN